MQQARIKSQYFEVSPPPPPSFPLPPHPRILKCFLCTCSVFHSMRIRISELDLSNSHYLPFPKTSPGFYMSAVQFL